MKKITAEIEEIDNRKPIAEELIIAYMSKNRKPIPISNLYNEIPVAERTIRHVVGTLVRKGIISKDRKCECGHTSLVEMK